jgi:hypothetical protein
VCYADCHYAEFVVLIVLMLIDVMLDVIFIMLIALHHIKESTYLFSIYAHKLSKVESSWLITHVQWTASW